VGGVAVALAPLSQSGERKAFTTRPQWRDRTLNGAHLRTGATVCERGVSCDELGELRQRLGSGREPVDERRVNFSHDRGSDALGPKDAEPGVALVGPSRPRLVDGRTSRRSPARSFSVVTPNNRTCRRGNAASRLHLVDDAAHVAVRKPGSRRTAPM